MIFKISGIDRFKYLRGNMNTIKERNEGHKKQSESEIEKYDI